MQGCITINWTLIRISCCTHVCTYSFTECMIVFVRDCTSLLIINCCVLSCALRVVTTLVISILHRGIASSKICLATVNLKASCINTQRLKTFHSLSLIARAALVLTGPRPQALAGPSRPELGYTSGIKYDSVTN